MNDFNFAKGECRHCGGHLEFPAEATGQTITCPHCGQTTELGGPAAGGFDKRRRAIVLGGALGCVAAASAVLLGHHSEPKPDAAPSPVLVAAVIPTNAIVATPPTNSAPDQLHPGETLTNNFVISEGKMQKTKGSSMVYIIGSVRNPADRQRFGVKVDFALYDTNDAPIGHATDYQSVIEAHGKWDFKAMVMESKAADARFSGITEQ